MTENSGVIPTPYRKLVYTRSTDCGVSWLEPVQQIDTVAWVSGVIAASPVSDRVVIAYAKPSDTISVLWNDVAYVLSQDGISWDFANGRINVTNYESDDDSLWANFDLDVVFDYNDDFHIIWTGNWPSRPSNFYYRTYLFHFNYATQQIDQIRTPWPDSFWPSICDPGDWNRTICKISLGVQSSTDALYAIWTQYDSSDCSMDGYANGDIWMSYRTDGGGNWINPVNLTNSHTPDCFPGECDDDNWASLADIVDDHLHIFYVNGKGNEFVANPLKYLSVTAPTIIADQTSMPAHFSLAQNYPNPFNSSTTISFELIESRKVSLKVYNIIGEKVATLIDKELNAGHHEVRWEPSGLASGLYYYVLSDDSRRQTKQMVLLK